MRHELLSVVQFGRIFGVHLVGVYEAPDLVWRAVHMLFKLLSNIFLSLTRSKNLSSCCSFGAKILALNPVLASSWSSPPFLGLTMSNKDLLQTVCDRTSSLVS